jgi:hypothetical protein
MRETLANLTIDSFTFLAEQSMVPSQHAFQSNTDKHFDFVPELLSIDLEQVSVSQLLGRDYVFINTQNIALPHTNTAAMCSLLSDLVVQLELAETHIVAVSVDESPAGEITFIRHDLAWYKHRVCRIDSVVIAHPEQYEFMEMIWHCSTAASTV